MRTRGYLPDPPDYARRKLGSLLSLLGGSALPDHTENSPAWLAACPVLDQSQTGSCTGHAAAFAIAARFAATGATLFVPSPAELYRNGRAIDRGPTGAPLTDDGAQPSQVWRAVSEFGVRPLVALPERFSDADPATINAEPSWSNLLAESAAVVVGEYGITAAGPARIVEVCNALAAQRPVTVAVEADRDVFQGYDGHVLTAAEMGAELDHYVALVDYCTVAGKRVFLARNSWGGWLNKTTGSGWGAPAFDAALGVPASWIADGHFLVDESAVQTMGDLVVADVRRAA